MLSVTSPPSKALLQRQDRRLPIHVSDAFDDRDELSAFPRRLLRRFAPSVLNNEDTMRGQKRKNKEEKKETLSRRTVLKCLTRTWIVGVALRMYSTMFSLVGPPPVTRAGVVAGTDEPCEPPPSFKEVPCSIRCFFSPSATSGEPLRFLVPSDDMDAAGEPERERTGLGDDVTLLDRGRGGGGEMDRWARSAEAGEACRECRSRSADDEDGFEEDDDDGGTTTGALGGGMYWPSAVVTGVWRDGAGGGGGSSSESELSSWKRDGIGQLVGSERTFKRDSWRRTEDA